MLSIHEIILTIHRSAIVQDLDVRDGVLTKLRSKLVLTQNDEQLILSEKIKGKRVEKLLDILPLKGRDAFTWFLESLEDKYTHLECRLRKSAGAINDIDHTWHASHQGCNSMTKCHRDVLTAKRVELVEDLLVGDVLSYLIGKCVFDEDHRQIIRAETTDKLKAEKLLDLLPTRGDNAFGHFVQALKSIQTTTFLADILVTAEQEHQNEQLSTSTAIEREPGSIGSIVSKEREHWFVVREMFSWVRKIMLPYITSIIETWHERLLQKDLIQIGKCICPENCSIQTNVNGLCPACSGWYYKLASSHRKKFRLRWSSWQNCDPPRWPFDPWEVAKFFMSPLGRNKNDVKNAESTDFSSLLNVLEWLKDDAFGEKQRIPVDFVKNLRDVRNNWAHSPNHEVTTEQLKQVNEVVDAFLNALSKICGDKYVVTTSGMSTQSLVAGDVTMLQVCEGVDQMNQENSVVERTQSYDETAHDENQERMNNSAGQINIHVTSTNTESKTNLRSLVPEKLSSYIGREHETKNVTSLFKEKKVRLVLIVGGPGFGKTTVAIEVGHCLNNDNIPVFFANLRSATTVPEVIVRLCHAVGVSPLQDARSSLIFFLEHLTKTCVLVMDNIDKLLDEKNHDDFIDLLRLLCRHSGKYLQILTTSRSEFRVDNVKHKVISLKTLARDSSIELVRRCCPEKCLDDDFVNSLAELCGDAPLALCIAASRLEDIPDPDQLLKWMQEDLLEVLKTPSEKVEKSIEMSFIRLPEEEQNHFVRLSVFGGNFDEDAVQAVTGLKSISLRNFLTNLVKRSLLERSGSRYSTHLLIRCFLIKRAESDKFQLERMLAQENMVKHFLNVCHILTDRYWSKDGSNNARISLQEDVHNIEKVMHLCQEPANQEILRLLRESDIYRSSSDIRYFYHFILLILSLSSVSSFLEACVELAKKEGDDDIAQIIKLLKEHIRAPNPEDTSTTLPSPCIIHSSGQGRFS